MPHRECYRRTCPPMTGAASPNRVGGAHGGTISMGARREVVCGGGGALPVGSDGVRRGAFSTSLRRRRVGIASTRCGRCRPARRRQCRQGETVHAQAHEYDAAIRDALIALWEASDRVCGKRLVAMIPALLPALERHGRLRLDDDERGLVLSVSAATIDRMLVDVKIAAAGGRRRRVGLLLGDPPRGADPHVQRLERSAARLLRDRHGGARRHVGGGLVHPDADDGGHRDGVDGVSAAGGARWQPRG